VFVAFFGKPSNEKAAHAHESGLSMSGPLMVLMVPTVVAGYFGATFAHVQGEHYHFAFGTGPAIASSLGLAGIALAYFVYGRGPRTEQPAAIVAIDRIAKTRIVNRIYEYGFHNVTLVVASGLAFTDRYIVDGLINLLGYGAIEGGRKARPIQSGLAPDYVLAVVLGVVGLAAWAVFGSWR
jgi:NADH:ubiquinone oxidoreductase subunit 5 (subunit L)/multisubunit Na+/H+ antiporter MnhA subunit